MLNIPGWFDQISRVYDDEGISPTLNTNGSAIPKIEVVGDLHNGSVENGKVYGIDGISPALVASAGDKGNHVRVDVSELEGGGQPMIEVAGFLGKPTQHYTVYSKNGIAPTLAACDYKDPTKIEEGESND